MAFFGLLRKKQKFDDSPPSFPSGKIEKTSTKTSKNMIDTSKPDPIASMLAGIPDAPEQADTMRTYDILVFEPTEDGTKKQVMVNGVKAHSPRELAALYAADGCQIQILKEYSAEKSAPPLKQQPPPSQMQQQQNVRKTPPTQLSLPQIQEQTVRQEPPKFFEIGGIKCKLDNGQMYQEQWVRVDSSKYRLVSDASNKIVSMNGKHLESLKWVLIDDKKEIAKNEDVENG